VSRHELSGFAERLGNAIAGQRRCRALSQAQLAKAAGLSLKYLGEIERAEANVSAEVLERLFVAMDWHPVLVSHDPHEPLPSGVRDLVRGDLRQIADLLDTVSERLNIDDTPRDTGIVESNRRGRPRKKRPEGWH
jgi:transcriptional regulator with XRE-family HTH domain